MSDKQIDFAVATGGLWFSVFGAGIGSWQFTAFGASVMLYALILMVRDK